MCAAYSKPTNAGRSHPDMTSAGNVWKEPARHRLTGMTVLCSAAPPSHAIDQDTAWLAKVDSRRPGRMRPSCQWCWHLVTRAGRTCCSPEVLLLNAMIYTHGRLNYDDIQLSRQAALVCKLQHGHGLDVLPAYPANTAITRSSDPCHGRTDWHHANLL